MKFLDYSAVAVTIPHTGFDPDFDQPPWVWAAMYRAAGWQVVPSKNKRPALHEWKEFQGELIQSALFNLWYGSDPKGKFADMADMGVITGSASGGLLMVDLDTQKEGSGAENWWLGVLAVHNNNSELKTWEQFTGGGGRQLFFQCPLGWAVGIGGTDLHVDIRCKGGFAVLPPTLHGSGNRYRWREGHEPWSDMPLTVAPPWLCDEIERLLAEHGGATHGTYVGDRPDYGGPTKTTFGTAIIDGRERYMRDLIWAAVTGYKAEGFPLAPREPEMMKVWADYARNVKVQNPLPGESHEDGLERERRGLTVFKQKWRHAVSKWDTDVAEAAKERAVREPRPEPPKINPETGEPLPLILTAAQFLSGYVPPSYLIDGMVQRGYLYSLTARTGHGKTAVAMPMGAAVARGITFHGKPCQQGSVLFLAGENSQDIRARYRALAHHEGFDAEAIPFYFVDGVIDLAASMVRIREEAEKIGELALIVVDTAQAYFRGDDVNNNAQQGQFAQLLRVLTRLPGSPTVIVNCHPVKNAARDNLVPMGGSHFINEVDANLTLWADERVCTLEPHSAKWRGAPFESIQFDLTTILCDAVKDAKGRHMPSVVAVPITEAGAERKAVVAESEEDTVLRLMHTYKNASQAYLAKMALFTWPDGTPYKTKVARIQARLLASKMVYRYRGSTKYRLTKKGCKVIGVKFEVETDDD